MIYYVTMFRININEAKTHLSRYLSRLKPGQVITICRRNVPVAEIRPIAPKRERARKLGVARGELTIPAAFFEPLPEEWLQRFRGET